MKFNVMKHFKIWIIATVIIVVCGMSFLGFIGLNNPVDYKVSYQIKVDVEEDVASSVSIAKEVTDNFFSKNGLSDARYAINVGDDGTITYSFHTDIANKVAGLEDDLQNALANAGINLEAKVNAYESTPYIGYDVLSICLTAGISLVVVLIYLMIMEKSAAAFSVTGSAVLSVILFVSLLAITRTPALPFVSAIVVFTALASAFISTLFVGKVKAEIKNVANEKLSNKEIAEKAFGKNIFPLIGVLVVSIISAILFIAIGTGYLKFLGIQIMLGGVSAVFSAGAWTPLIWTNLRKGKIQRKATAEQK